MKTELSSKRRDGNATERTENLKAPQVDQSERLKVSALGGIEIALKKRIRQYAGTHYASDDGRSSQRTLTAHLARECFS